MQLNLELTPEDGSDVSLDRGLASPMGGKHQRDLSLSAKWANNKALALEYLKRQRVRPLCSAKPPDHGDTNEESVAVSRKRFCGLRVCWNANLKRAICLRH